MRKLSIVVTIFILAVSSLVVGFAQDTDPAIQAKIENAMLAAPAAVAQDATIIDNELDADGKFIVLREGSNGWYCLPDLPSSPSNDPECMDQTWLDFTYAFMAGAEPNVTTVGVGYMLLGGTDPSNTDPFATAPAPGEDWVVSPPHIMLLFPGKVDLSGYSTDSTSGKPYVMWAGTPYEHIMLPVANPQE